MWKVYSKTPRRFEVIAVRTGEGEIDYAYCSESKLNDTVDSLYAKYENDKHVDIQVKELLNFDWEDE